MYLAVTAVFRNESKYIREWVAWHRLQGVEFFLLVDNNIDEAEKEATRCALRDYLARGVVEIVDTPPLKRHFQIDSYFMAVDRMKGITKWLAIIDIDEFIQPTSVLTIPQVLRLFEPIPNIASLSLNWAVFGTSGIKLRPELCIQAFTRRTIEDDQINRHLKQIVMPHRIKKAGIHYSLPLNGFSAIDTKRRKRNGMYKLDSVYWGFLRVVHYMTRSEQCWADKEKRGFPSVQEDRLWTAKEWASRKKELKRTNSVVDMSMTVHTAAVINEMNNPK